MKKILLLAGIVALAAIPMQAQEKATFPRHYISLSVGDSQTNLVFGSWDGGRLPLVFSPDDWFRPEVYNKMQIKIPTFSISYYYSINTWLMVGGELYCAGDYVRVHERVTDEYLATVGSTYISILPSIRFQYINRKYWGLYSGASIGLFLNIDTQYKVYTNYQPYNYVRAAFQATAIGVRFGDKIYGFAEAGVGHKGFITIGLGTRF